MRVDDGGGGGVGGGGPGLSGEGVGASDDGNFTNRRRRRSNVYDELILNTCLNETTFRMTHQLRTTFLLP
jgi:hypothetical protein